MSSFYNALNNFKKKSVLHLENPTQIYIFTISMLTSRMHIHPFQIKDKAISQSV